MIEADRKTLLAVGALVVAALLLVGGVLTFLGTRAPILSRRPRIEVHFRDVAGLREGAPVLIAGVSIGSVVKIRLAEEARGAVVLLDVQKRGLRQLRADASASLRTIGLLGDRVVALEPGGAAEPLPKGKRLIGESADEPLARAADAADRVARLATRVDQMVARLDASGAVEDVAATVASARRFARRVERGPGILHALAYDRGAAADLRAAAERARQGTERIVAAAGSADDALDHVDRAAARLDEVTAHVRSGQGTLGGLVYDPAIYESLRTVLGDVSRSRILRALVRLSLRRREGPPPPPPKAKAKEVRR